MYGKWTVPDILPLMQEWLGAIIQQVITSRYYLSQCWPRSMPLHGVTQQDELFLNAWPQSVNIFEAEERDILLSIKNFTNIAS